MKKDKEWNYNGSSSYNPKIKVLSSWMIESIPPLNYHIYLGLLLVSLFFIDLFASTYIHNILF